MRRYIGQVILAAAFFAGMNGTAFATLAGDQAACGTNFFSIFTDPNTSLGSFSTGPYADLCITLTNNTTAQVTVNALPGFLIGSTGTLALEVNSTSFSVTGITDPNISSATISFPGQNVNGFGRFDLVLDSTDGFGDATSGFSFTLHDLVGTWANAGSVLTTNANGADAEVHVFVTSRCNAGQVCTGFAAEGPGIITEVTVPEPGMLSLLGAGLLGMGFIGLRRKS